MQTFLPYPDFEASAHVLDSRRLGKQRVEALQILNVLDPDYEGRGWRTHPAVLMWREYGNALVLYGLVICDEWTGRGYRDSCYRKIRFHISSGLCRSDLDVLYQLRRRSFLPPWFGEARFHASHRSNLLRKDPVWYGRFGWVEPNDLPYVWPVRG